MQPFGSVFVCTELELLNKIISACLFSSPSFSACVLLYTSLFFTICYAQAKQKCCFVVVHVKVLLIRCGMYGSESQSKCVSDACECAFKRCLKLDLLSLLIVHILSLCVVCVFLCFSVLHVSIAFVRSFAHISGLECIGNDRRIYRCSLCTASMCARMCMYVCLHMRLCVCFSDIFNSTRSRCLKNYKN